MTSVNLTVLILAIYSGFAAGGWIVSGALTGVLSRDAWQPVLRGVSTFPGARWKGMMWLPGKVIWLAMVAGLAEGILVVFVGMFLLLSPLFALAFVNHLSGLPSHGGALAQWYQRWVSRRMERPHMCRPPSRWDRFVSRWDDRFSR
jgi:hypothetical protein